jgi:peptide/nickel transport system permease protein
VTSVIGQHIQPTLLLSTYAILLAILIGVPLGTIAALRHGSLLDRGLMSVSLIGVAAPSFLIALILIIVAAVKFHILPSGGYVRIQDSFFGNLKGLILPAISLSLSSLALIARITRSAVLEVLGSDYVRTAHAKGLKNRTVVVRHILRSALLNVITIIGLVFAGLMGGTVVIETVFHIPGIGSLIIHAVIRRDFPLVQGTILYITFAVVLVNLIVDLLYAWIDPRVNV